MPHNLPRLLRHRLALFASLALLAFLLAGCSGDDEPAPAATSDAIITATPEPESAVLDVATPVPTAQSSNGSGSDGGVVEAAYEGYQLFGDFTVADAIEMPADLMLLVAEGCSDCEDGLHAVYRVWRNNDEARAELLIDATVARDDEGKPLEGARLTSVAVRPTLHDIVVTVCTQCAGVPGAIGPTTVFRSIDGGMTWREVLQTDEALRVRAVTDQGTVLEDAGGSLSYLKGDATERPSGAGELLAMADRAGELWWLAEDGSAIVDADGTRIAKVEPGSLIEAMAVDRRTGEVAAMSWGLGRVTGPYEGLVVTKAGPDGRLSGFRYDGSLAPVAVVGEGLILGHFGGASGAGKAIGFVDVSRGFLTPFALPIAPHRLVDSDGAERELLGAVGGPFLRVTTGSGCLPIRVATDDRSEQLTCAVDGTLVYDLHNRTIVGAQEWQRVGLLDGREGYTVARYLSEGAVEQ